MDWITFVFLLMTLIFYGVSLWSLWNDLYVSKKGTPTTATWVWLGITGGLIVISFLSIIFVSFFK